MIAWMEHDPEPDADSQHREKSGLPETMSDEALMENGICPVCHDSFEGAPDNCSSCGSSLPPELNVARFVAPDPRHLKLRAKQTASLLVGSALGLVGFVALANMLLGLFPAWGEVLVFALCFVGFGVYTGILRFYLQSKLDAQLEAMERDEPKQLELGD